MSPLFVWPLCTGSNTTASPRRYCQNLAFAPLQQQPLPGQYHDNACVLPIGSCLLILFGEAIGFLLLAIYFDNVLPDENGMRQSLWCGSDSEAQT